MTSTSTPSRTIMRIIATHGPLTNRQLFEHIPSHPELVSARYIKSQVLVNLANKKLMFKKMSRATHKPVWLWNFTPEGKIKADKILAEEREKANGNETSPEASQIAE